MFTENPYILSFPNPILHTTATPPPPEDDWELV